ncbi:MAG: FHA domain-containing protein [bacterium]|nr:FHA domain-containing protein [bacterium]
MTVSKELLEILVCPITKGPVYYDEKRDGIVSEKAGVVFPVQNGVPVMLEDEAYPLQEGGEAMAGGKRRLAIFEIAEGKNKGEVIKLPVGTCKAIGRSLDDMNKTQVFNMDFAMSLDDMTKKLIMNYIAKKSPAGSSGAGQEASSEHIGSFKRLPDLVLDDGAISRLHAMMFHDASGAGILDLVSKNGTYVNGEEVESKTLQDGDLVEVGSSKLVFSYK